MTNNQRLFEQELKRLQRSVERLTKQNKFIQTYDLPAQPKRITRKRIKQLQQLKGRHFVSEIDIETGEVVSEAEFKQIYEKKTRSRSYAKPPYDPVKAREYREAHKEEIREANRHYREAHKEEIRERQRAYRQSHKDEIRAKQRAYREANKERINRDARARRRKKKLEQRPVTVSTAWDIYQELLLRFNEAKQEALEYPAFLGLKLQCIDHLIGTLMYNREQMGNEYLSYLKKREQEIAEKLHRLIQASTQDQVNYWYTDVLDILNAQGIEIPRDILSDLAQAEESGEW